MLVLHPLSQCDICTRQFSDNVPPYAIPCGHIFCSRCFGEAPIKSCALCRRPYTSRNIKKLHVDYALVTSSESIANPEAGILHRLAEALVLGDNLAPAELTAAVEEVDRWLSLSAKSWEFKGLRNIRELIDEYSFVHREYYRLLGELDAAQAHMSFLSTSSDVEVARKSTSSSIPNPAEVEDPPQPSKFESLIDMLKEHEWDSDMLRPNHSPDQPSPILPSLPLEEDSVDNDQQPFHYAIDDYQHYAPQGIAASRFTTGQRGARVPTQYNRSLPDMRRQLAQRGSEEHGSSMNDRDSAEIFHGNHRITRGLDGRGSPHRMVRFTAETESESQSNSDAEDNGWLDLDYEESGDVNDPHRQLTLRILERGHISTSPPPMSDSPPPAPRVPTLSLSLSISSLPSNHSGSRRSRPVSVVTMDSVQSDRSWGTQSSAFSHMPGLRTFSSMRPRSSSSSRSGMLLMPQSLTDSLRRRRGGWRRSRLRSGAPDAVDEGFERHSSDGARRPRPLPYFPLMARDREHW